MAIYKSDNVFQHLDLSPFRHFFAIASFGGFSKASRATGLSQPALSLGLQKLEKTLSTKLIDRKAGEFALTVSGRVVFDYCKRLEGTFESMLSDLGDGGRSIPRRLRIGTGLSVGFGPLVKACVERARSNGDLELELVAHNTYHLLTEVLEGSLDAAIVPDDVFDRRLKMTPLFRDRLAFVHSPSNPASLASRKSELKGDAYPVLVTYPRETPMRTVIDRLCGKHDLRFSSVISVNGLDAIVRLVSRGVGGAFVLRTLVSEELKRGELQEAKAPFDLPYGGVALITAQGEHGKEVVKILKKLI